MTKSNILYLAFIVSVFWQCTVNKPNDSTAEYLRFVGDTVFDHELDDPAFTICNGENYVFQYFNLGPLSYAGEKPALDSVFRQNYKAVDTSDSGLIRIRFIVNCEGKTGWFRVIGMDENYNVLSFDNSIIDQLLKISEGLTGWQVKYHKEKPTDYYQYLIFRIKDGRLTEIMP